MTSERDELDRFLTPENRTAVNAFLDETGQDDGDFDVVAVLDRNLDEACATLGAEAELDRANETLAAIRLLVAKWAGPATAGERMLADAIIAITGGPWGGPDETEGKS